MQQAEQQRVCQNNPFGRLNSGRAGGRGRGGGGIPLRGDSQDYFRRSTLPPCVSSYCLHSVHEAQVV